MMIMIFKDDDNQLLNKKTSFFIYFFVNKITTEFYFSLTFCVYGTIPIVHKTSIAVMFQNLGLFVMK